MTKRSEFARKVRVFRRKWFRTETQKAAEKAQFHKEWLAANASVDAYAKILLERR